VLLRGATSCGHLGVWAAAALINHSCAPNCHAMLLGDRLVSRCARDLLLVKVYCFAWMRAAHTAVLCSVCWSHCCSMLHSHMTGVCPQRLP
jgi:hypothetical protein